MILIDNFLEITFLLMMKKIVMKIYIIVNMDDKGA